jgi:hypothetical protein
MFRAFQNMIERQIQKAQMRGELSNIEGEGKPLPDRSSEALVDPAIAAGMRMMAQAGVVPEEFALKEKLANARRDFQSATDPNERKEIMARMADLEMRHNMARDARRSFLK